MNAAVNRKNEYWLLLPAVLLLAAAMVYRCTLGADISDEAFAVGETYLTIRGSFPFVDMWFPMAFTMLSAPFMKLFLLFSGGSTEGIILYMRLAFLVFKLLTAVLFCVIFRKKLPVKALGLSVLFLIPFEYCNLLTFSYTLFSVYLVFIAAMFLAASFWAEERSAKAFSLGVLSGIFGAFGVLAHPSQAIVCVLLGVVSFVYELTEKHSVRRTAAYVLGGAITAVITVGYMAIRAGGVSNVIRAVRYSRKLRPSAPKAPGTVHVPRLIKRMRTIIKDSKTVFVTLAPWVGMQLAFFTPAAIFHTAAKNGNTKKGLLFACPVAVGMIACIFCSQFTAHFLSWIMCLAFIIMVSAFLFAVCLLLSRKDAASLLRSVFSEKDVTLCVTASILVFYAFVRARAGLCILDASENVRSAVGYCFPPFIAALLFLPFAAKRAAWVKPVFAFLWCGAVFWVIAAAVTTDGYARRVPGLMGGIVCFLLFLCVLLPEAFENRKIGSRLTGLTAFLFALMALSCTYAYSYVEAPLPELDTPVTQGVYKGLRTTKERAEGLMALEAELRANTDAEEYVLFLDNVPMAYLMTDAMHCSPDAWDGANYSKGANSDRWYLTYFKETGKTPDKIIYIHTGRDDHVSILEEGYKFNDFVHDGYIQEYENDTARFPLYIYSRK